MRHYHDIRLISEFWEKPNTSLYYRTLPGMDMVLFQCGYSHKILLVPYEQIVYHIRNIPDWDEMKMKESMIPWTRLERQ